MCLGILEKVMRALSAKWAALKNGEGYGATGSHKG